MTQLNTLLINHYTKNIITNNWLDNENNFTIKNKYCTINKLIEDDNESDDDSDSTGNTEIDEIWTSDDENEINESMNNDIINQKSRYKEHTIIEQTLLQDESLAIKFAPGENVRPVGLSFDTNIRELSMPTVYCGQEIETTLNIAQLIKSEARRYDRRAAKNITWIALNYCLLRIFKLQNHIQICLRKKNQMKII